MKQKYLSHQFVQYIPEILDEGILYVSERYSTVAHKCCCGCGEEIVTPLSPTDWSLKIEHHKLTLYPSIGNWSLHCQSHYWIRNSKVVWAGRMTKQQIEYGRAAVRDAKKLHFEEVNRNKRIHESKLINLFHRLLMTLQNWFK